MFAGTTLAILSSMEEKGTALKRWAPPWRNLSPVRWESTAGPYEVLPSLIPGHDFLRNWEVRQVGHRMQTQAEMAG